MTSTPHFAPVVEIHGASDVCTVCRGTGQTVCRML